MWVLGLGCSDRDLPVVRERGDVAGNEGRAVAVEGVYRQVDVRMRPVAPAVLDGHAAIELSDGTRVFLEPAWSDAAIRPASERALEGQRVRATGVIHAEPPTGPEEVAMARVPTVAPVRSVVAVGP